MKGYMFCLFFCLDARELPKDRDVLKKYSRIFHRFYGAYEVAWLSSSMTRSALPKLRDCAASATWDSVRLASF